MKHAAHCAPSRFAASQAGVVLITGLVFMVILTVIVLALMRNATLEERMASNARDRQLALQAAEAVTRDARETLFPPRASPRFGAPIDPFDPTGFTAGCTNGFCAPPASGVTRWKPGTSGAITWTDTGTTRSFAVPANSNISGVSAQPRYFVELIGPNPSEDMATESVLGRQGGGGAAGSGCPSLIFRVNAHGVGRDASNVYVESTFAYQPDIC